MSTDASAVAAEAASHATLQQTWRTPGGVLGGVLLGAGALVAATRVRWRP